MINFCGAILCSILPFPPQLSKPFPGPDSPIDVYVDSVRLLPEHILLAKVAFNRGFGGMQEPPAVRWFLRGTKNVI